MKRIVGTETEFKMSIISKDGGILSERDYNKIIHRALQKMIGTCADLGIPFNLQHEFSGIFPLDQIKNADIYFDLSRPAATIERSEQDIVIPFS